LRVGDHPAHYAALRASRAVFCILAFDTKILDKLPSKADRRVEFIWHSVAKPEKTLVAIGGTLLLGTAGDRDARLQLSWT